MAIITKFYKTREDGVKGWWGDVLMESTVGNNTYTPEQYAPNWREVVR